MGKRRGQPDWLKKVKELLTSEAIRECFRMLFRWLGEMISDLIE
ncbi:hypothetical protein [Pseudomonas sp.]